jgi:hypothetical protein
MRRAESPLSFTRRGPGFGCWSRRPSVHGSSWNMHKWNRPSPHVNDGKYRGHPLFFGVEAKICGGTSDHAGDRDARSSSPSILELLSMSH